MHGACDFPGCTDRSVVRPTIVVRSRRPPDARILTARTARGKADDLFQQAFDGEDSYEHHYCVLQEFCSYHQGFYDPRRQIDEAAWAAMDNHATQLGYAPPSKDALQVRWHAQQFCPACRRQVWPDELVDEQCCVFCVHKGLIA